jgi:hypothetical protein
VSTSDFLFSMRLTGREQVGTILGDVAAHVFHHVGCAPEVVNELVHDLRGVALPDADRGEHVDVQFRARTGSCEVTVSVAGRVIWRTVRDVAGDAPDDAPDARRV